MSDKLQSGMTVPDFELPDENGEMHRLSELQGDDPMILLLGRGEHCPRERQRFFGRPSAYQLWEDLQNLFRRIKDDYDPTLAPVREAWEQANAPVAH